MAVVVAVVLAFSSTVAMAQGQAAGQFLPTAGWALQPNSLSEIRGLTNVKLPCMISNGYDNGFVVRFSGNDSRILAMAIDFRQSVFQRGRQYDATIQLGQDYSHKISGSAFGDNVLIFNLRNLPDFRGTIGRAYNMVLNVEGNRFSFALGDVARGIGDMTRCFKQQDDQAAGAQTRMKNAAITPDNTAMTPAPVSPNWDDVPTAEKMPTRQPAQATPATQLWEAKAGTDLRQVLAQWSQRAGVELSWQAGGASPLPSDIRVQGSFEDAVQTLMAQQAAAQGFEANLVGSAPQSQVMTTQAQPQSLLPSYQADNASPTSAPITGVGSGMWVAPAGSSLRAVLEQWSNKEGVELVWGANHGFAVKQGVNAGGAYEDALMTLLEQYSNDADRPVAQLNNDPVSGKRTLFIQSSRVL